MRRSLPVTLLCAAILMACAGSEREANVETPSAAPNAANATYLIDGRTVTLSQGKANEPAAPGSASRNVTALTSFEATGDIDADGKPDRAIVLTSSPGGSGTFYYLAALPSSGSAPLQAVLLGDRISVSDLSVSAGLVTVNYLTRPDGAPFTATPSVPSSRTFKLTGGQLTPN